MRNFILHILNAPPLAPSPESLQHHPVELQNLWNDTRWLAKASDAIVNLWRSKNSGRRNRSEEPPAIAA
jgi:hypothetical protein